jgi:hypothetical protein
MVWSLVETGSGTDKDIWGIGLAADGTTLPGWGSDSRPLCTAPQFQGAPSLALCTDETFKVAWVDDRNYLTTGEGIYFDHFAISDGTVPTLAFARLISRRIEGRAIRAAWRLEGGEADTVFALRAVDQEAFEVRTNLERTGYDELTLSDSLPEAFSHVRYFLAFGSGRGRRAISDTLDLSPGRLASRFDLRCASPQRGGTLMFELRLNQAADGVKLSVFDVLGRRVREVLVQHLDAGSHQFAFDLAGERQGLYFLRATDAIGRQAVTRVARVR